MGAESTSVAARDARIEPEHDVCYCFGLPDIIRRFLPGPRQTSQIVITGLRPSDLSRNVRRQLARNAVPNMTKTER